MRHQSRRGPGGRRGTSIVEVILAVLLLSLIFLSVTPGFMQSELTVDRSRNMEIATQAAQAQLDTWREQSYAALPTLPSGVASLTQSFTPPAALPHGTGQTVLTRLNGSLVPVTTEPAGSEAGRRRIAVTVSWDAGGSDRGSVTLTSLMIN
jgi:type II secretory pathway pseudopilin PulG